MDARYFVNIDGVDVPIWATKSIAESDLWELRRRTCWELACEMAKDVYKHPEMVRNPQKTSEWEFSNPKVWFQKFISDSYFYKKCKDRIQLDEKAKAPLQDLTNRQVIEALYFIAWDKIWSLNKDQLTELLQ